MHIINRAMSISFMVLASIILILSITLGLEDHAILSAFLFFIYIMVFQLLGHSGFVVFVIIVIINVRRVDKERAIMFANLMSTAGLAVSIFASFILS